jgi:hypothetical protein
MSTMNKITNEYRVNGILYGHFTEDGKLTNKYNNNVQSNSTNNDFTKTIS